MEFQSFAAMAEHKHPRDAKNSPRSQDATPWVPGGMSAQHAHTKLGTTQREREAAAVEAARAEHAVERDTLSDRLAGVETSMGRLEAQLDAVTTDFEQHVVSATAAHVLVAQRLRELGM